MDSRIYFHQYRRPRVQNPTYQSNNVQGSMTFFERNAYSNNHGHQPQQNDYIFDQPSQQKSERYSTVPLRQPQAQQRNEELRYESGRPKNNSNLSNYGHNSISFNQKDVHNKQSSRFDIISLKPKQYSTEIRQYPWLTVENKDDVYFKKMNQIYNTQRERNSISIEEGRREAPQRVGVIAGKHTYANEGRIEYNPQKKYQQSYKPRFTAKMLNHMDELRHLS